MRKLLFIPVFFLLAVVFTNSAVAVSLSDITFPIQELGNCEDKEACAAYCDNPANKDACVTFGEKHGLINKEQAEHAKKLPKTGPGGCEGENACREYCNDEAHGDECLAFAEQHGLLDQNEIKRAKEFRGQTGPGGCRGANECRDYCDSEDHLKECLEFANRRGLISERDAKIATEVVEKGGPGGCKGDNECRTYCEEETHLEECLAFAEKHGLVSSDEASKIRQFGGGVGPGGCRRQECKEYCANPAHQEECITFAVEKGFMTKEDAERARKFSNTTGPGGCRGEECRTYCDNPERAEECLSFAEKEGLIPKEEALRARKFMKVSAEGGPGGCKGRECENYCNSEEHQDECFKFAKEKGLISHEEIEKAEVGMKLKQKLETAGGPGGCKSEDECREYCSAEEHAEECVAFAATHGGLSEEKAKEMLREFSSGKARHEGDFENVKRFEEEAKKRFEEFKVIEDRLKSGQFPGFSGEAPRGGDFEGGGFSGPGGCKSPDECRKYCSEHLEECFKGPMDSGRQEEHRESPMNNFEGERMPLPSVRDFPKPNFPEGQSFGDGQHREQIPQEFQKQFDEQFNEQFKQKFPEQFDAETQRRLEEQRRQLEEQLKRLNTPIENQGGGDNIQGDAGPGGCMDEVSCGNFCEANPEECRKFEERFEGQG